MIFFILILPLLLLFILILILRDLFKSSLIVYVISLFILFSLGVYYQEIFKIHFDSLFTSFKIFLLVFSLLLLFEIVEKENREFFFYFKQKSFFTFITIGVFLTILIEGLVGFGTPGMISVRTLYDLGFNPILSASISLISDLYSTFGAFGTPIIVGNKDIKDFSFVKLIGIFFSILIFFIFFTAYLLYKKFENLENLSIYNFIKVIPAFLIFSISSFIFSQTEFFIFTIIFSSLASLIFLFIENKDIFVNFLKMFYPFFISILLFIFFKLLKIDIINSILLSFNIAPIVFLVSIFFLIIRFKKFERLNLNFLEILRKSFKLFLIVFFLSFLSNYLITSGKNTKNIPSALDIIKNNLTNFKSYYFLIAPIIGIFGSFIFGSATLSNLTFINIQKEISLELNLEVNKILALQNIGAGIGNIISLFNIAAITTMITELRGKEIEILKINFILAIIFSFFSSLSVYFLF